MSPIALGSWRTFEHMRRGEAERLLAYALRQGIDFLDDARYDDETGSAPLASGYSEVLFGELFRAVGADPQRVAVSNKLWWEFWPQQTAVAELEESLQRMGLERLALLYSSALPDDLSVAVAVEQIGDVLATTPAIAFTLCHPRTAATLIGATRPEQIDEALAALELAGRLTDDNLARLRDLAS